jgi:hypothetical protein
MIPVICKNFDNLFGTYFFRMTVSILNKFCFVIRYYLASNAIVLFLIGEVVNPYFDILSNLFIDFCNKD